MRSSSNKQSSIYLDYAASTPLDPRVKREMVKYLDLPGNPSSVHAAGREAKAVIDNASARISTILHCRPEELIFTGSGTEANNLAIFGFPQDAHMVSTNIEHHSILRPLQKYTNVTYVPVQSNGIVDPQDIAKAIRTDTVLVSVIYANNEIGTIQPIKAIRKVIGKILFHTDACQASGFLNLNVQELGVDLMTLSGSKMYGPKGVGCLFVRRGTRIAPQILGGDQQRGLRAGTESPALIAGFAKALELADRMKEKESARLTKLRDWFIAQIPKAKLNGDPVQRLANNINISFDGIDGEMLMLKLDERGICVSTGAACTVSSNEPSHVLRAIGQTQGNIRITLGRSTTKRDLTRLLEVLPQEVERLQKL